MDKSQIPIQVEAFSFDNKFNRSVAQTVIIKQRIILDTKLLKLKHSETYFISNDNQILLISYSNSKQRVDTMRMYYQDGSKILDAENFINQYAQEQNYQYVYSKKYDVSHHFEVYQFLTIQRMARDIAATPYTGILSNCNHATSELIRKLYPFIKIDFNYYGSIGCQIF